MKKLNRLVFAIAMIALLGCASVPVNADDFEVLWAIDLPRDIYFIGETVTFTVLAYSSTLEAIFIPGEMALVTIRNSTYSEMYAGWITTNQNGSAPISWDIPLESAPQNYTIILQPIIGEAYTATFYSLFDQDTYWQKRVEQLEEELNRQYEYLNYLFGSVKYLNRQTEILKQRMVISGVVMFITIMATMVVVIPEWARRSNNANPRSMSSKIAKLLGFSSTPKVLLTEQHEELAQLKTPDGKNPPRYGLDYTCELCDPDKKLKMTKKEYEDHITSHYKHLWSIKKWRANRLYKDMIADEYPLPELRPPHERILADEKRKNEIIESVELSRKELKAIDAQKKKYEQDLKDEQKRRDKEHKSSVKAMKKARTVKEDRPNQVVKSGGSQKPELQRKVRVKKQLSGIPVTEPEKTPMDKTAIDDLLEKLMSEKVN